MQTFNDLHLPEALLKSIADSGYTTPTPIQAQAIPLAVAGRDLQLSAQTGSGKTAAFVLPILTRLIESEQKGKRPRALILTPTRELALQVHEQVRKYGKELKWLFSVPLVGGAPYGGQIRALKKGVQIIVATPGRLLDHLRDERIDCSALDMLVLDEADRMLDMGFIDDIRKIMQMLPKQRQTLLFSATFAPAIRKLAKDFMNAPEIVEVAAQNTTSANVEQHIIAVDALKKRNLLERLIVDLQMNQVIVFCKTKQSVDQVTRDLVRRNLAAQSIHGDKSQQSRLETLNAFKEGSLRVLVATDVAARGLDIAELPFVINYELPTQPEDYVHRIGRTGRAGADGVAISLMDKTEQKMFEAIKELTGNDLAVERIEGFEPQWWGGADTASSEESRPSESRRERRRDNARKAGERSDKPHVDKTDPGAACGKIAGRNRRSRRERQPCALLQPNYGA